jgi:hypothetical protein
MLYARTTDQIYAALRARVRDTTPGRWQNAEVYAAINSALDTWDNRVLIPHVYSLDYATTTREYDLPQYIRKPLDVQYLEFGGGETTWCDYNAYQLRPNSDGGLTLHLSYYPFPGDGRIIFWTPNSRIPNESVALSDAIDSDDTSLTVDAAVEADDCGYVQVGTEWIGYAGLTLGTDSITLNNLERGALGTTAAAHDDGTNVLWGIAAHRNDLFTMLERQAMVFLHEMFLSDGSAQETEVHERIMNWNMQMLDKFWRAYVPMRSPKVVLTSQAIGEPLWNGGRRKYPSRGDHAWTQ